MAERGALEGRHAVVTGGGRGIGLAIARRLASMGATLTLMGRDRARLQAAARELRAQAVVVDVSDDRSVEDAFASLQDASTGLAILVNNAGVARSAKLGRDDVDVWREAIDINLTGTWRCTRAALPMLLEAPEGRIVNVASTAGLVGYPYVTAYCASKHGVVGLTRALALELAGTRVTVNAVCPGYTDTDIVSEAVATIVAKTGRDAAQARETLARRNPQRRLVTPDEVASAVAWLCLPESGAITGQALPVAGGEVQAG